MSYKYYIELSFNWKKTSNVIFSLKCTTLKSSNIGGDWLRPFYAKRIRNNDTYTYMYLFSLDSNVGHFHLRHTSIHVYFTHIETVHGNFKTAWKLMFNWTLQDTKREFNVYITLLVL